MQARIVKKPARRRAAQVSIDPGTGPKTQVPKLSGAPTSAGDIYCLKQTNKELQILEQHRSLLRAPLPDIGPITAVMRLIKRRHARNITHEKEATSSGTLFEIRARKFVSLIVDITS